MILAVGTTTLRGSIEKFALGLLEVQVASSMPRASVLARYRQARPEVQLALRLVADGSQSLASHPDVARALDAARACSALTIVVSTGPRYAPTEARRTDLIACAETLRDAARFVAWEPRGIWQPAEAEAWAAAAGVVLVRDVTQEEPAPGPICYTRVRQLGVQSRISQGAVERLADSLGDRDEAYVVVEGDGARTLQSRLVPLLGPEGSA